MAAIAKKRSKIAGVIAADKAHCRAAPAQLIGQRSAAHDMTAADAAGSVCANGYLHACPMALRLMPANDEFLDFTLEVAVMGKADVVDNEPGFDNLGKAFG